MRFAYGANFDPPAPILPIRVSAPGNHEGVLLHALVDTGADLSVVPSYLAEEIGLPAVSLVRVRAFDGVFRSAILYAATLEINGVSAICEVLAMGDGALVGRDFLNRWALLLNGPRQFLELRRVHRS